MLDRFSPRVFLGGAQRRLFTKGVPVLVYHGVKQAPAAARDPFLYTDPRDFDGQLAALRSLGFKSATLDDMGTGNTGKVVITFDDGCRNVFENAMEPLARHGFHAIQFLVADMIGGANEWDAKHGDVTEPLMNTAQIREWLAAGHQIGSHSLTHRNLVKLDAAAAREQISGSRKRLEDLFGIEVRHFCYPHGKHNEMVRDLVAEAGYATACTTQFGVNTPATPRFQLNRITPLSESALCGKIMHRLRRKIGGG